MAASLLLVDDSPTIAKILTLALASEDYLIQSVQTAGEALQSLERNPPDLCLIDYALPEQDGFAITQHIRSNPKLAQIKVAILANAFDSIDESTVKAKGADALIIKPFDPPELRATLKQLLLMAPLAQRQPQPITDIPPLSEISKPNITRPSEFDNSPPIDIDHNLDISETLKEITKSLETKNLNIVPEAPSIELEHVVADWAPVPQLDNWQQTDEVDHHFFDTGNSTFRFSADYIQRIKYPTFDEETGVPKREAHAAAPDNQTMEQIIREEVQKMAGKILPELAESLIRKELDKVLKAIDSETT